MGIDSIARIIGIAMGDKFKITCHPRFLFYLR
jgi:hypothetical protein